MESSPADNPAAAVDQRSTTMASPSSPGIGMKILSVILLIVFGLMSVLTVVSNWSARQIHNPTAYLRTVSPLASNEAIQEDLAARISTRIQLRLAAVLPDDLLAERGSMLAAPMRQLVDQYVNTVVLEVLQSDQFQTLWDESQRIAHNNVERVLTGVESDLVSESNGTITLDISPIIQQVLDRLSERGLEAANQVTLDNIDTTYVLFHSDKLGNARNYVELLDTLRWVFPLIGLIAAGLYLFLSRNRWRAGMWIAVTLAISMTVFLLLLATGRWQYLLRINPDNVSEATAAAYYDVITHSLRVFSRWTVLFSLLAIAGLHFFKPGGRGRKLVEPSEAGVKSMSTGPSPLQQGLAWVGQHRLEVAGTLIGLSCLIIIALDKITTGWAIIVFLLASLALFILITRPPAAADTAPTDTVTSTAP